MAIGMNNSKSPAQSTVQNRLLRQLYIETFAGKGALYDDFRVANHAHVAVIRNLEATGHLEIRNGQRFFITLIGLKLLEKNRSPGIAVLFRDAKKLFVAAKEFYLGQRNKMLSCVEISRKVNFDTKRTFAALKVLRMANLLTFDDDMHETSPSISIYSNIIDAGSFEKLIEGYSTPRSIVVSTNLFSGEEIETKIDAIEVALAKPHLVELWRKAQKRILSEPEGAITLARTLLEAVFKEILEDLGEPYQDSTDLAPLYTRIRKLLRLEFEPKISQHLRSILQGSVQIVDGVGGLRNAASDAHGRTGAWKSPPRRLAMLSVYASGAVAAFLVETLEAQKELDFAASK